MARIPRLYRVRSVHLNGKVETRHYQGPEAASLRHGAFELDDPKAIVTTTPSHPVMFPLPSGDPSPLDVPDGVMSRKGADLLLARLGIEPSAVQNIIVTSAEIVVQYQPDQTGKREPKLWRIAIEEES